MKFEIFLVAILPFVSFAKSLPPLTSIDTAKFSQNLQPRDLTYDLSFGWFGTNDEDGEKSNPNIKIASQIHDTEKTETVKNIFQALEKQSKEADNEQQKNILNLIQDFTNVLVKTPERYAQILLNNVWHTVDMGAFGSPQRLREVMTAESFIEQLKQLLWQILKLFYNYVAQEMESKSTTKIPGGSGYNSGSESSEKGSGEVSAGSSGESGSGPGSGSGESDHISTSEPNRPSIIYKSNRSTSRRPDSKEWTDRSGSIGSDSSASRGDMRNTTRESPRILEDSADSSWAADNSSLSGSAERTSNAASSSESDRSVSNEYSDSSSKEKSSWSSKESTRGSSSGLPPRSGSSETYEHSTRDIPSKGWSIDEKQPQEGVEGGTSDISASSNWSTEPWSKDSVSSSWSTEPWSKDSANSNWSTEPWSKENENFTMVSGSVNTNRPCPPQVKLSP